jgi:hypothetical protein
VRQYNKKHEVGAYKPVRAVFFLFFTLFLLSNCQIKKTLRDALLGHSGTAHTTQKFKKGLPAATSLAQDEACDVRNNAAYADQDLHTASEAVTLPSADLFTLSYLPFLLVFAGFYGDVHSPLADFFKVLATDSGSPIYIKNRYLLI